MSGKVQEPRVFTLRSERECFIALQSFLFSLCGSKWIHSQSVGRARGKEDFPTLCVSLMMP